MFVEAGLDVANFAWDHRKSLGKVAGELFGAIRSGRLRVLVFGAGGVGKSTVGKLLARKLNDEELLRGYVESFAVERFGLGGTVTGRVLVAPGQRRREHAWDEMLGMIASGKVNGVVNVTAYGYHSLEGLASYKEHRAFAAGMTRQQFLRLFLEFGREEEIKQLERLVPALVRSPEKLWFLTLVTKQDLWWDKRTEVKAHYETGRYNELITQVQTEVSVRRFPHEIASASLTWQNLRDGAHEILASTVAGYDQQIRLANLSRFSVGLGQLAGIAA
jgi:energy-coupling factor transporter ATP-binding protein EcfA2